MIHLMLDQDGNGKDFDRELQNTLPDGGDLKVITKSNGTKTGQAVVMLKFSVQLPGGAIRHAQTVVTARLFIDAAAAVAGCHPQSDERRWPKEQPGHKITGKHRNVGYDAVLFEKMYLVHVEGLEGISFAGSEDDATAVAHGLIDKMVRR